MLIKRSAWLAVQDHQAMEAVHCKTKRASEPPTMATSSSPASDHSAPQHDRICRGRARGTDRSDEPADAEFRSDAFGVFAGVMRAYVLLVFRIQLITKQLFVSTIRTGPYRRKWRRRSSLLWCAVSLAWARASCTACNPSNAVRDQPRIDLGATNVAKSSWANFTSAAG